jgi:hypothetical protein
MSEQPAGYYQTQVASLLKEKSDFLFLGIIAILLVGATFYMTISHQKAPAVTTAKIDKAYMAPKPTAGPMRTYVVQEGESLTMIAEQQLGNGDLWTDIVKLNNITDINTIVAGTKLLLPTGVVAMVPSATQAPSMTPVPTLTPAPAIVENGDIGEGAMTKKANLNIKNIPFRKAKASGRSLKRSTETVKCSMKS